MSTQRLCDDCWRLCKYTFERGSLWSCLEVHKCGCCSGDDLTVHLTEDVGDGGKSPVILIT
jgi:hypothetical protein